MTELMLKPDWPARFRRLVGTGKKSRLIVFEPNRPVEVTAAEMNALKGDIGVALFEIDRDEKGRPRFIETVEADPDPTRAASRAESEADESVSLV